MVRDMELIRKILFAIEEQYIDVWLGDIKIEGYDSKTIAYHCKILHDAGLVSDFNATYADNELYYFGVGSLTWEGHDFLDKIRTDTVWNKTKDVIKKQGLPMLLDVVKDVASTIVASMTEGAIKALK